MHMKTAIIDGISTRYDVVGDGPPLLMYAPGGFDAMIEKWSTQGVYAKIKPMDHLPKHYSCIVFDRRECGQSGGRVERVTYAHYVQHGAALLDHLKFDQAHLIGGCMGCSPVALFGVMHPQRVKSMILYWPVGGAKYRMTSHARFAEHLGFVAREGMAAVVKIAREGGKPFGTDPRGGPWAAVLQSDEKFAESYAKFDVEKYKSIVAGFVRTMFDRDTAPGAEPEDMLGCTVPAYIVPGNDASHATSAARYLHECLPKSEYWDVPVAAQTEDATMPRLIEFLKKAD
jgi:pimeloyl-ACP methyl ester carboxylesterase